MSLSAPLSDGAPYEFVRSRELNALLGPKGSSKAVDLVCDLHNTTANMGLCLIAYSDQDWICLHIFKHLQANADVPKHPFYRLVEVEILSWPFCFQTQMPDVPMRYIHFDVSKKESYSLDTVGKHGFGTCFGFYSNDTSF